MYLLTAVEFPALLTNKRKLKEGALLRPFFCALSFCYVGMSSAADVGIEIGFQNFDYTEYSESDIELDNESGFIPVLTLEYQHSLNAKTKLTTRFSYSANALVYDGQTQQGAPHITKTDEMFANGFIQLEYLYLKNNLLLKPEFHYGYNQWYRDIRPANNVLGLFEKYSWHNIGLGLQIEKHQGRTRIVGGTKFSILPFSNVNVDLSDAGYSKVDVPLPMGFEFGSNIGFLKTINSNTVISAQWSRQYRTFQVSEVVLTGNIGILEPRSLAIIDTLSFGLSYQF